MNSEQELSASLLFCKSKIHLISRLALYLYRKMENTMKNDYLKTLISVCTLIAALIIWTMWSNTALMLKYGDCFKKQSYPCHLMVFRMANIRPAQCSVQAMQRLLQPSRM